MEGNGEEAVEECHIALLPNEMLTEVLQYVSTRQLLRCRDVSSRWNRLASSLSRQRHVHLFMDPCCCGLDRPVPNNKLCLPRSIQQVTFAPWSAHHLTFPLVTCRDEQVLTDIPCHLDTTLSLITKFTATLNGGQDDVRFFRFLERMPSLQVLCIETPDDYDPDPDFVAPDDLGLDLSKLKEVDIEFTTKTGCHLLEFILTRPLTSVRRATLRELAWVNPDYNKVELGTVLTRIWPLLVDIESVTLDVTYYGPHSLDGSTLMAEPRSNLKRLVIDSGFFSADDPNHFKALEEFFGKYCQHLDSLSLKGFKGVAAVGDRLRQPGFMNAAVVEVPALPELRHLHIYANDGLLHFSGQQFLRLCSVHLRCDYALDDHLDLATAFGNQVFSTVRFLELEGFSGRRANWGTATAFPNLKVMGVKVKDADQLSAAFSAAIGLDRLTIDFKPNEGEDADGESVIDLLLYKGLKRIPQDIELRKLVVKTPTGKGLCDRSAILLNLLKPLHLVLWNAENLSDNCLSQLRNYHLALHLEQE